ncbi:hypothetical protein BLL42_01045 [Pseudomonas frederiksbergensis]|uniref:Lipoprotein n=1 Tax=Pseudomonas frederiksbergensis TaxID=104087 RepID=A0A1J0EE64_9PSED|nr:hypothetical protein [Pseudomonas frederiksbergensis]APC14394.1 hypothetical protein BLL42_01045 [Pseudomonas frederiksbergensis]
MTTLNSQVKSRFKIPALGCCLALTAGCATGQPNTFTFTADLPPDFAYQAIAVYEPAKGETCSVPGGRNTEVGFNLKWRESYTPNSEIALRRTVSGCPLVIRRIKLEINATYGKTRRDFGGDDAVVAIRDELEEQYKGTFNEAGESTFHGQCQWLFRTSGKPRILRKILDCKETDAQGEPARGRPFSAYTLDQLPGKTVKMTIKLADEERPGWGDTWVKVPNGWKRCMGKGFEDQRAYCNGNHTDFSGFQMPDGQKCTIYPGCTE